MALLAEELVEEWLNRQGYFSIRGVKIGVDEIDLLAVKFPSNEDPICRHIEVQASVRPMSYLTGIPKSLREPNQSSRSAKARSTELLEACVKDWVIKKYFKENKTSVIESLFPSKWSSELVINNVKYDEEVDLIRAQGINVIRLTSIIKELKENTFLVKSASGADFADLLTLSDKSV